LIPPPVFEAGIRYLLNQAGTYLFYMHPWEIDPGQPKMQEISRFYRFRHYLNLDKTYARLRRLTNSFAKCEFATCRQYLQEVM
jgi:hypothetical protein